VLCCTNESERNIPHIFILTINARHHHFFSLVWFGRSVDERTGMTHNNLPAFAPFHPYIREQISTARLCACNYSLKLKNRINDGRLLIDS